jgi:hypothetical protein
MTSTADYIRSPYLRKGYSEALARHNESVRVGLAEYHRQSSLFPSTVEGGRGPVSQLGGQAVPKSEEPK